jgi:hypothetical protein
MNRHFLILMGFIRFTVTDCPHPRTVYQIQQCLLHVSLALDHLQALKFIIQKPSCFHKL